MNYNFEQLDNNTVVISFTLAKEEIEKNLEAAAKTTGSDDAAANRNFVINQETFTTVNKAIAEHSLKLGTNPITTTNEKEDGSVEVNVKLILVPAVELPSYTGLGVEKAEVKLTDEEVEQQVTSHIQSTRLWNDVPADQAAKLGDQVIIDFVGTKDGVAFDGDTAEKFPLVLGSGQFIPGFEDQLVGVKVGEVRDVNVTFPENYGEPTLAGAPAVFKCTVHAIQEMVKPEPTDEFVAKMNIEGVKTIEELRNRTRADLLATRQQEVEDRFAFDILTLIAKDAKMDIPQEMIDSQIEQAMQQYESQVQQFGMTLEDFLKASKQSLDDFKANVAPQAAEQLRSALVLDAIALKEKIIALEEDVEKEYELLSSVYNFPAQQLKMMIPADAVSAQIVQRKTLDFLKENNKK